MNTYVIIVSQTFPKTHTRAGQPTNFISSILDKSKKHTIRGNYDLWKQRFEQIESGHACLSVRVWEGKPYRSKQLEVARFYKEHGIGIEKICFLNSRLMFPYIPSQNKRSTGLLLNGIAKFDGLSLDDFREWFKGYDLSQPMAIIHFTNFRYEK